MRPNPLVNAAYQALITSQTGRERIVHREELLRSVIADMENEAQAANTMAGTAGYDVRVANTLRRIEALSQEITGRNAMIDQQIAETLKAAHLPVQPRYRI